MIDPKLNELADTATPGRKNTSDTAVAEDERPLAATPKPRPGLSVNDTVAANANLSVGARGTDTSGVRAGAGAGAGSSYITPGTSADGSSAAHIQSGPTGSGTTPLSDGAINQTSNQRESASVISNQPADISQEDVASHAYRCWHERGCPEGSPEEDWHRAEQELREHGRVTRISKAGA